MKKLLALFGHAKPATLVRAGGVEYHVVEPTFEAQVRMSEPLSRIAETLEELGPQGSMLAVMSRNGQDLIDVVAAGLSTQPTVVGKFTPQEFDAAFRAIMESRHGPFVRQALAAAALTGLKTTVAAAS